MYINKVNFESEFDKVIKNESDKNKILNLSYFSPTSGMASVAAVDADVNGTADLVGGDRYGNIWKIDLSSDDPNDWKSAFDDGAADENPLAPVYDVRRRVNAKKLSR